MGDFLSSSSFIFVQFLNGLTIGMIFFLIASGLTLLLGVLGLLNLAHGSFYMLGAFIVFSISARQLPHWFWLSLILAPIIVGTIGTGFEKFFLKRMYHREKFYVLLFTFAWVLVFDDLVLLIWGREFRSLPKLASFAGSIDIYGNGFPVYYLFIIILGALVGIFLRMILLKTTFGMLIRACADDSLMVNALGINTSRVYTAVFALGTALAGLGGVVAAPIRSIASGMGLDIIIQSFIIVVIGGMGSLTGALLGAILIGQLESFGILIFPKYTMILMYALLAFVLIIRPSGLFGRARG